MLDRLAHGLLDSPMDTPAQAAARRAAYDAKWRSIYPEAERRFDQFPEGFVKNLKALCMEAGEAAAQAEGERRALIDATLAALPELRNELAKARERQK